MAFLKHMLLVICLLHVAPSVSMDIGRLSNFHDVRSSVDKSTEVTHKQQDNGVQEEGISSGNKEDITGIEAADPPVVQTAYGTLQGFRGVGLLSM